MRIEEDDQEPRRNKCPSVEYNVRNSSNGREESANDDNDDDERRLSMSFIGSMLLLISLTNVLDDSK